MSNLERQTAVERTGDGTYRSDIVEDWKMWVPIGGYLTSIALRAAQAHAPSTMARPVSVSCHYLNEAKVGPADLEVTTLRSTDRAGSYLVRMNQDGQDILAALVSAAPTGELSPTLNWQEAPEAARPDELETTILDDDVLALMGDEPFWKMLEFRMVKGLMGSHNYPGVEDLTTEEMKYTPRRDAHIRGWQRMPCGEGHKDPWVDACRSVIITAAMQFATVADPFTPPLQFIAPTMNLTVDFHTFHPEEPWLLADAVGSHVGDGILGAETRLWTQNGDFVATANSKMTYHDFSDPRTMERLGKSWFQLTES
ncbi:thioesterase family protein [Microtetraspora malaysiensis]|uniref:thioesterase family protein n=1 Tax=Microtetraspora malaysiensis TaxID=161358 RepID=UPI003D921D4F